MTASKNRMPAMGEASAVAKGGVKFMHVVAIAAFLGIAVSCVYLPFGTSFSRQEQKPDGSSTSTITATLHDQDLCNTNETEYSVQRKLPLLELPETSFTLLHIGKAGGGAYKYRLENMWRIHYSQCHPAPCSERLKPSPTENAVFVITIRDPIDRFVSSFYWLAVLFCNPDGDERRTSCPPAGHPERCCRLPKSSTQQTQQELVYHKYNKNVNLLAESLCDGHDERIDEDMKFMGHAKYSIVDWLADDDWKSTTDVLYPIVLEDGFSGNPEIDNAVQWVNNHTGFLDASSLARRQTEVHRKDCALLQSASSLSNNEQASSSSNLLHSSASEQSVALSPLGEKCLAQYYRQDYAILKELKNLACKSENCRLAIQSILDRRAPLLWLLDS